MKKWISLAAMTACCGLAWSTDRLPHVATVSAQAGAALYDWTTDGGDNQRTGWNKQEKALTKDNVKNLKLLWKLETKNQVRALHSLMPVLVVGQLNTPSGVKHVGFVSGISDNLYAFDADTGKIIWQKHWDYEPPGRPRRRGGGGGGGQQQPTDPAHLGFLRPGGSSDTPVIGPPDAQGRRPIYFITGDGMLHILNAATGEDLQPSYMFHLGKGWSLNLVDTCCGWRIPTPVKAFRR
jgi:glucose dehydrogenase